MVRAIGGAATLLGLAALLVAGCGPRAREAVRRPADAGAKSDMAAAASNPAAAEFDAPTVELMYGAAAPGQTNLGIGPGLGGDKYERIDENAFLRVAQQPLSTFSIDVDTASYAKTRMYLLEQGALPPVDAVRIEELVNYFDYRYEPPTDGRPFAAHVETAACPWNAEHRLARIAIKGREVEREQRPAANLVFLVDVSGSMNEPNKLPLLKQGLLMLVDQLNDDDRVAIVVYAGAAGVVLESTPGDEKRAIVRTLERLEAGGSTAGGEGIELAYQTARDNFIKGGVNRVLLCTDGDFNVGVTSSAELERLVEERAKQGVELSVLGFGMGNHNDAMLEGISNIGNGNYAFIDSALEARKALVEELSGTLVTIAKDVKIQVEFNPAEVAAYRLLGYENRLLAAEDFNDDQKDAGEIGAGHCVTAFYEIAPAGVAAPGGTVDDLKYQQAATPADAAASGELATIKLRFKPPGGDTSELFEFAVSDSDRAFSSASEDFQFAAAVAAFGMLLRDSQNKGNATFDAVAELAAPGLAHDPHGYRQEFVEMVQAAKRLAPRDATSLSQAESR